MPYTNVALKSVGRVAIVRLNAPDVLNALSFDMVSELHSALGEVIEGDARCLVLTGEGRAFCAGANLNSSDSRTNTAPGDVLETHYHPVMNRLRHMDIPMVTAINGPAVGVGMSFAVMADYAIAARRAYFLQAFANIGMTPDGGVTWVLPRIIGWRRALEPSMLAERLPTETAQEWGLINRVVDDALLMEEAMEIADKLANGPMSLGLIRKAYWESFTNSYAEQFQLEANYQAMARSSKVRAEGIAAFMEKRPAEFTGE